MKTVTTFVLASVCSMALAAPVHANTLTDTLADAVSKQLTELSSNIKQQARQALEHTVSELFFNSGNQQAEQAVQQSAAQTLPADQEAAQPQPKG